MRNLVRIVTLLPSPRWRSTIEFHLHQIFDRPEFLAAIDFRDCLHEVKQQRPAFVVVEIQPHQAPNIGRARQQSLGEVSPTLFVAVGDKDLEPWSRYLRVSGFADVCVEISQVGHLCSRVFSHWQSEHGRQSESLEERIQDLLPWRPVAKTGVSGDS